VAVKVLLDTNAYSALMRGHAELADRVRKAEQIVLSAVVAGELLFGFRAGTRLRKNLAELEAFLGNPYVSFAPVTYATADRFGRVAAALRARGRPIPSNDLWIAAHTLETGAELLSFDRHFAAVDGLAWTLLPRSAEANP
jgi:tRNA(fMet)-specific endonuclease VapC